MPYVTEQNLTDAVLERWKAILDPRLRQVMQSFIKHMHAFVRDIEPTRTKFYTIRYDFVLQPMVKAAAAA